VPIFQCRPGVRNNLLCTISQAVTIIIGILQKFSKISIMLSRQKCSILHVCVLLDRRMCYTVIAVLFYTRKIPKKQINQCVNFCNNPNKMHYKQRILILCASCFFVTHFLYSLATGYSLHRTSIRYLILNTISSIYEITCTNYNSGFWSSFNLLTK